MEFWGTFAQNTRVRDCAGKTVKTPVFSGDVRELQTALP
jgi:hypothetical protein